MKTNLLIAGVLVFIAVMGFWFAREENTKSTMEQPAAAQESVYTVDESDYYTPGALDGKGAVLTAQERQWLTYMREEEKLARDVYQMLGEKWGLNIFTNIAASEETHMSAVLTLLDGYGIPDPVQENTVGEFVNPELQTLYTQLIEKGSVSLEDALIVGATIEDLDIKDLDSALAITTQNDIRTVYANLQKGSRNHLRAFTKNLKSRGGTYTPQYITQEAYDAIIAGEQERGKVGAP